LVIHDANVANQYYQEFKALITFTPVSGCTEPTACNYNSTATVDDASCLFLASPCDDGNPNTINDVVNLNCECAGITAVAGCMDISACNFSPDANTEDNSCIFIGDPCDDGLVETTNDQINANCECEGLVNSIQELTAPWEFACYPNPAKEKLNVRTTAIAGTKATIIIRDSQGKTYSSREIYIAAGDNVIMFDTSHLAKGIYSIALESPLYRYNTFFVKD
jgi:hypothetical protein